MLVIVCRQGVTSGIANCYISFLLEDQNIESPEYHCYDKAESMGILGTDYVSGLLLHRKSGNGQ